MAAMECRQAHEKIWPDMDSKKKILAFNGSASRNSSNEKLIGRFTEMTEGSFEISLMSDLKILPHFDPERSLHDPPEEIVQLRRRIEEADGIFICTPEYVFSIPSGLKNLLEWCVATTVFTDKPLGILTASAHGQKGHEELQVIMRTLMARFDDWTTLLIQGIKGKIDERGQLTDGPTLEALGEFAKAFRTLVKEELNT